MHIRNISAGSEWQEVEFVVVGGAPETVIGEGMLSDIPTREGAASRRGVLFESASRERIVIWVHSHLQHTQTHTRVARRVTAQVCDGNRALLSVRRKMESGHTVVFSNDGSYILDDRAGKRMQLQAKKMAGSHWDNMGEALQSSAAGQRRSVDREQLVRPMTCQKRGLSMAV